MRARARLAAIAAAGSCALAAAGGGAAADAPAGAAAFAPVTRHLVGFDGGQLPESARARIEAAGGHLEHSWPEIGWGSVSGLDEGEAASLLEIDGVSSVSRDVAVQWIPPVEEQLRNLRLRYVPGVLLEARRAQQPVEAEVQDPRDAFFYEQYQWNMRQMQADRAWDTTRRGAGTLVCVLDSGVDATHIDLAGKLAPPPISTSVVESEPFLEDLNLHGTFVSALIVSNGLGIGSVAPDAQLCAIKVLNVNGTGTFAELIAGILHAREVGADVINLSLGALLPRKGFEDLIRPLQQAIWWARLGGVTVVASSGNDAIDFDEQRDWVHVPSMLQGVLSVGATGPVQQQDFDELAPYSNFGRRGLDVVAPGGRRPSTTGDWRDGIVSACSSYAFPAPFNICAGGTRYLIGLTGTSLAAPHAAGAAAVARAEGYWLPPLCVVRGADRIGEPVFDPVTGWGRVNVPGAAACRPQPQGP